MPLAFLTPHEHPYPTIPIESPVSPPTCVTSPILRVRLGFSTKLLLPCIMPLALSTCVDGCWLVPSDRRESDLVLL